MNSSIKIEDDSAVKELMEFPKMILMSRVDIITQNAGQVRSTQGCVRNLYWQYGFSWDIVYLKISAGRPSIYPLA